MKKATVAISFAISLLIAACGNSNTSDTTTNMPDSGYEPRTDTTNANPVTTSTTPAGAVKADSIFNGQTGVSGVKDSSNNKHDSSDKK